MEWPSQSPDLNPLENLWHYIKVRLRKRSKTKSEAKLMEHVNEVWRDIPQRLLNTLIESMPRHVKAVIKAKGGHTKYWRHAAAMAATNKVKAVFCVSFNFSTSIFGNREAESSSLIEGSLRCISSVQWKKLGYILSHRELTQLIEKCNFSVFFHQKTILWATFMTWGTYLWCPTRPTSRPDADLG